MCQEISQYKPKVIDDIAITPDQTAHVIPDLAGEYSIDGACVVETIG
jgi:hypothetical protein